MIRITQNVVRTINQFLDKLEKILDKLEKFLNKLERNIQKNLIFLELKIIRIDKNNSLTDIWLQHWL